MREKVFYPGSQFKDIGKIDTEPGFFHNNWDPGSIQKLYPRVAKNQEKIKISKKIQSEYIF